MNWLFASALHHPHAHTAHTHTLYTYPTRSRKPQIYIEGFNMVFGGLPVFTANSSLALAFHILGWSPQRQPYPKVRL